MYELEQTAVKCMRGILFCYMKQSTKVCQREGRRDGGMGREEGRGREGGTGGGGERREGGEREGWREGWREGERGMTQGERCTVLVWVKDSAVHSIQLCPSVCLSVHL